MPKIDLTYEQVLEAVKQLTADEQEQLSADVKMRSPGNDYPPFTADDPLWSVMGIGHGTGEPVARKHDDYLYRKSS